MSIQEEALNATDDLFTVYWGFYCLSDQIRESWNQGQHLVYIPVLQ